MFNNGEGGFIIRTSSVRMYEPSRTRPESRSAKNSTERRRRTCSRRSATCFRAPGADTTPVEKISFVTKVGDLGCGVGYYK